MTSQTNRKSGLLIALILLALSAFSNIYFLTEYSSKEEQLAAENLLFAQKDSLQQELQRMEDSLSLVLAQLNDQGGSLVAKSELMAAQAEIAQLRKQLSMTSVQGSGSGSKSKIVSSQLQDAQDQIAELHQQVNAVVRENDHLLNSNDELRERNQLMGAEYNDLASRANQNKRILFGSLMTQGVSSEGSKTLKANQIKKLTISCESLENALIDQPIVEEVVIRIIDPNGGVLSTTNTTLQNKSEVSSLKVSITYDGSKQKLSWKFPLKGELDRKLKKGQYTTELWTGGLLRQKNTFELF